MRKNHQHNVNNADSDRMCPRHSSRARIAEKREGGLDYRKRVSIKHCSLETKEPTMSARGQERVEGETHCGSGC